ncbi:MAG TPA: hypothetical protein VK771_10315 [Acidimicrobiia bacterium]|nr:hypothetical protein [Acidimicrobiia bacterium]
MLHAAGPAMEEGFMLAFPDRVLHGAVANKDFFYLYGPGSLWVLAAIYKIFGVHILVERAVGLAQLVGVAVGAATIVRWWGRWVAVAAILLSVMFVMPSLQLTAIPYTGGVAIGLASLAALVQARHDSANGAERTAQRWAIVGGVAAGAATLYRIDLAPAVMFAGAAALWGLPRPLARRALAGLAVGVSPYALQVALAGPDTVWRGMIVDPILHLRGGRRLPVPPSPSNLQGLARVILAIDRWWPLPRLAPAGQLFAWFWLLAFLSVGLVGVAIWCVRRSPDAFRPRVLLAGALFGLATLPQAIQRADSAHFAWVSAVVVVLIPAAIVEVVTEWRPTWPIPRLGLVAGVAVIVASSVLLPTYTTRRYVALVQDSFAKPDTIPITNDGRTFYVGADPSFARSIESLLAAVDHDAKPGSRIIVGNTDLRRTPNVDTFLYYLLPHAVPGTYFMEFEPGLTNRAGTRLTAEMRRADLFIASDRWLGWDEPNTSMEPGDPGPGRVLRRDFCLQASYGNGYALYRHCSTR